MSQKARKYYAYKVPYSRPLIHNLCTNVTMNGKHFTFSFLILYLFEMYLSLVFNLVFE